jgi:hypothetical protein
VFKTLRLQSAQCHGIAVGTAKSQPLSAASTTQVLSNGYSTEATDVSARGRFRRSSIATHIPRSTKKKQLRPAPVLLPASQMLKLPAP